MQKNKESTLQFIIDLVSNRRFIWDIINNQAQRKHLFRWIKSLKLDYLLDTPSPWLVFDAIDHIRPYLFKGMNIFEYGSGSSTLFWLQYGANVVSIEHNLQWFNLMKNKLKSNKSIDYRLILPEKSTDVDDYFDPSEPEKYLSSDDLYRSYHFRNYVTQIDEFPDQYFDIVLIDGRARPSCIKHSINKVKVGGQIILDNSDRDYYILKNTRCLANYSKVEFHGLVPNEKFFSKTAIYTRQK
jgi:hypothetical protein